MAVPGCEPSGPHFAPRRSLYPDPSRRPGTAAPADTARVSARSGRGDRHVLLGGWTLRLVPQAGVAVGWSRRRASNQRTTMNTEPARKRTEAAAKADPSTLAAVRGEAGSSMSPPSSSIAKTPQYHQPASVARTRRTLANARPRLGRRSAAAMQTQGRCRLRRAGTTLASYVRRWPSGQRRVPRS